jgi:hypothetical protein
MNKMDIASPCSYAFPQTLDRKSGINQSNIVHDASNGTTVKTDPNAEDTWISQRDTNPVYSDAYNHTALVKAVPGGATASLDQVAIKCKPIGKEAIRRDHVPFFS